MATTWRDKVHPFFIKSAEFSKTVLLLTRHESEESKEEIERLNREVLTEILKEAELVHYELKAAAKPMYAGSLSIYGADNLPPGSEIPRESVLFCWLCFCRFNKTLAQLLGDYQLGSMKAARQVHKLSLEYDSWRFGQIDPNKLKFKIDWDHFELITAGLGLGVEQLTPIELADCFDALCPCGKPHFPENLNKLRTRVLKAFPRE
ncbi:MAG: hypothetical protein WCB00_07520 [Candidatus Acidiferrales bacterium]